MKTQNEERFDVVIYEIASRKVDAIIGENMKRHDGTGNGRNTAELRQQTGMERVNDAYAVEIIPTGTAKKGDKLP